MLDEADRVLDGGFDNQLRTVLAAMPKKRKTLLFTATVSDDLRWMVREASDKKPFVFDASEDQGEDKQVILLTLVRSDGFVKSDSLTFFLFFGRSLCLAWTSDTC